ncbi:10695_t:CDS:2, partial [Gigaspora rosea]
MDKKIEVCTDKSDDLKNLLSGEGPGNFIRAEVQLPEVISSGEGPGNFLKSGIYSFQNLTEPSNFTKVVLDEMAGKYKRFIFLFIPLAYNGMTLNWDNKECDFNNIEMLFDTDSSDLGFEKVDNTVESFESLRYYDTTDKEYVAIIKEPRQKELSQKRINENYSNAQANENQKMSRIIDLSFLIFSKLHNEGFNEEDINRNIEKYITMNDETPRGAFVWLLNNKENLKQICLLGRFYHGGIGTNKDRERAFYEFFNVKENTEKNEFVKVSSSSDGKWKWSKLI